MTGGRRDLAEGEGMTTDGLIATCLARGWSYRLWSSPTAWEVRHHASVAEGGPPFAWVESGGWVTPAAALENAMHWLERRIAGREAVRPAVESGAVDA